MFFVHLVKVLIKHLGVLSVIASIFLGLGLAIALFVAPEDARQGDVFRMIYIHVPAAWFALWNYAMLCLVSILFLWKRMPLLDHLSFALAKVGLFMTALALVTGSLWGRATWGAWWVWDGRLTSTFLLLLLYMGYHGLRGAIGRKSAVPAAILILVGAVDLPIIILSVEWWGTLHQPGSLIREGGVAIAWPMLWPLLFMACAFLFINIVWVIMIWESARLQSRLNSYFVAK